MSCNCCPPVATGMEVGWSDGMPIVPQALQADAWEEEINFNLPQNQQVVWIPFSVVKANTNILISGAIIENLIDASPLTDLSFTPTQRTRSGIEITLNALLDSPNYYFRGFIFAVP